MFHSQPRKRIYFGQVVLGSQPLNWIRKHRSFAGREWFDSQVKYGEWIGERNKPKHYIIYVDVPERVESIKVIIKIRLEGTHVLVHHVHVIG